MQHQSRICMTSVVLPNAKSEEPVFEQASRYPCNAPQRIGPFDIDCNEGADDSSQVMIDSPGDRESMCRRNHNSSIKSAQSR